ncbi:MAG: hypothetical protein H6538_00405 [Bacteroidales bacterium]|nr:hypothetical protein [Bacteroidales bacterium]MCB8998629.1 hypothetical protein [Bacteroidales bacterium]MCB9012503.1 hypothetical protein [Bacteroidales bacterium]
MKADFDIGNLVYVILTIVFLAVGALGKKKKPPRNVTADEGETEVIPDIRSQFMDLFKDVNPVPQDYSDTDYIPETEKDMDEEAVLDSVPEDFSSEYAEETVSEPVKAEYSNIDYSNQAKSSLDTTGMDEGESVFDYNEGKGAPGNESVNSPYYQTQGSSTDVLSDITEDFDARKAFIYSEIFKRKEF